MCFAVNSLAQAAEENDMKKVVIFVERGEIDDDAVYFAAMNNNLIMVKYLLGNGMKDGLAVLHALVNNNTEMAYVLYNNGAFDLLRKYGYDENKNVGNAKFGKIPPKNASSLDLMRWLLDKGVEYHDILVDAVIERNIEMIKLLKRYGYKHENAMKFATEEIKNILKK